MNHKIIAFRESGLAELKCCLRERISPYANYNGEELSVLIKKFGLQQLLDDRLLRDISEMTEAQFNAELEFAEKNNINAEYLENIQKHSVVILAFAMRVLDIAIKSHQENKLVFLGRGADLIYDAALLLTKVVPRYKSLANNIFLIDFSQNFPSNNIADYFSQNGVQLKDKIMLVDDYESSVGFSSRKINSAISANGAGFARNYAMVKMEVFEGDEEYTDENYVGTYYDCSFRELQAASVFLSNNGEDPPNVYFSGRKIGDMSSIPIQYEYNNKTIRYLNRAHLYQAAIQLLFSSEEDLGERLSKNTAMIGKIKSNVR